MKKLIAVLGLLIIICAGAFFWLLMQADASKAPQEEVVIDLTDQVGN